MLKDTAKAIYLERNMNCAEAVLHAADEEYGYHLNDDCFKLIGGFGGGCACGHICGAVAASIASLGYENIKTKANETPGLGDKCKLFMETFTERHGSVLCADLKAKDYDPTMRCYKVVQAAAELLEEIRSK